MAATVRPTAVDPLELAGAGFAPGESVTVIVVCPGESIGRRVTAGADGTWTLAVPELEPRGRPISIRAHGGAGSAALHWPRPKRPGPPRGGPGQLRSRATR